MRLVASSQGRLCMRFIQRPDGGVLTKGVPERIYRISRRVSRIAAGAFTATLSLSGAAAQSDARSDPSRMRQSSAVAEVISAPERGASLSGVVTDPKGAVVSGAIVTLANTKTHLAYTFTTTDDGVYKFSLLEEGAYELTVEAATFQKTEVKDLELKSDDNRTVNVTMELPEVQMEVEVKAPETITVQRAALGGVIAFVEPEDPLVKAAYKDDLTTVKQIIFGVPDVNLKDKYTHEPALTYAIEHNNREMVRLLLAAGADVNLRNNVGQTAAMHLTAKATPDLVRDLLYGGADFNARDNFGDTPLLRVASTGTISVIKELIEHGANMGARDDEGITVLMKAAENDDSEIAKFLINAGVDVNAKSKNNETALMCVARSGKPATLQLLIDARSDIDAKDSDGKTALILAAANDDPLMAKALIAAGADVNANGDDGSSALMAAASDGQLETLKLLIDAGADVNAKDRDGQTALMLANDVEHVSVLLRAGADITIKDKDGETALSLARKAEQEDVVKFLLAHGARE